MKNIFVMGSVAAVSLGLMLSAACSDSETSTNTTATTDNTGGAGATGGNVGGSGAAGGATGGSGGSGPIEVPTLGAQIDRKGRPAINTATTQTFTADATRTAAEQTYNANDDASTWLAAYEDDIAASLAILDALGDSAADGNCGDQAFFGDPLAQGAGWEDYHTLAKVLANDWLVIDSAHTDCGYLGVELELGTATDTACGGRTVADDVMDATYGAVSGVGAFGDGIPAPPAAQETAFPYLAAPN